MLAFENLHVAFPTRTGMVEAVRGVSLEVGRERLGIVGESGSGKSTLGRAVLGLLPPPARVTADRLEFAGIDLLRADARTWRKLRGDRIGMVLQDPKYSLNPVMRVGAQIEETLRDHGNLRGKAARRRVLELLADVKIRDPERVARAYPHELSGGMGQRAMIAMMLAGQPDLLILDEPTSALDVTVQLQVLAILDDLVRRRGMALIFISHDLELVATFCDRVAIMYAGRIVEVRDARTLHRAEHPYTRGLLGCLPRLDRPVERLPVLQRDPAWLEPAR
jgi:peptide/nickel transport system ATP-binding protein